jgi:predicted CopG family antitoxin
MKTINETFSDEEFERLTKVKDKKSWHDFILELAEEKKTKEIDRVLEVKQ